MEEKISIYGLGKLGCTMLACFAHKGWQVVGVDVKEGPVSKINEGISPIYEPRVDDLIKANRDRISATTNPVTAALATDISYVIVPTPSLKDGSFSIEYVEEAVRNIAQAIKNKNKYHLVVITSTVMPGHTEALKDLLEDVSGKVCGKDFGVCYNPDFIALGKIVHDFLNPDMILIGESDQKSGDLLEGVHSRLVDNHPEYHRMGFHSAELSKIGLNAYCTLKITYANVMGEICELMTGGDADKVLDAIGADSRVGKKYFRAGLGFSGPCVKPNTLVHTDKGLKRIDVITVQDKVMTHTGKFQKVTKTFVRYYHGPLIKIIANCPKPFATTPEHPVWCARKKLDEVGYFPPEFVPSGSIKQADVMLMPESFSGNAHAWKKEAAVGYEILKVIEEPYEGSVHNLEVEEDNTYVLEWGTVHNCFPRDNRAFNYTAKNLGVVNTFAGLTDNINNYQKKIRIPKILLSILEEKGVGEIAVLGVTYKENVTLVEESPILDIIQQLCKAGKKVYIYDPAGIPAAKEELQGLDVVYTSNITQCLSEKSVCFVGVPWKEFKVLTAEFFMGTMESEPVIFDACGIYQFTDIASSSMIDYRKIGTLNTGINILVPGLQRC